MHFWCNFLGIKKVYKVENQLLVDYSERRGRDWLLRSLGSLRLTPFPSARRRGPYKPNCTKSSKQHLLFSIPSYTSKLVPRYKKQKVSISRYLFVSWPCGEGGTIICVLPHFTHLCNELIFHYLQGFCFATFCFILHIIGLFFGLL